MPQLYESLLAGQQNLWLAYDNEGKISGAATTMIINYPNMKMLAIQFLGGTDFDNWGNDLFTQIEKFAKDCTCEGVEAYGRFGFWPFFQKRKYKRPFITYELFED